MGIYIYVYICIYKLYISIWSKSEDAHEIRSQFWCDYLIFSSASPRSFFYIQYFTTSNLNQHITAKKWYKQRLWKNIVRTSQLFRSLSFLNGPCPINLLMIFGILELRFTAYLLSSSSVECKLGHSLRILFLHNNKNC